MMTPEELARFETEYANPVGFDPEIGADVLALVAEIRELQVPLRAIRIELTDSEETALHLASSRGTTEEMTFNRTELKAAVESIIAARVSRAVR